MTGINNSQIRVAPFGHVSVAAYGSTLPTDVTTALNAAFSELGYLDDTGVTITPTVSVTDLKAWQSLTPVKTLMTELGVDVKINQLQVTQTTTGLYFFGDSWTITSGIGKMNLTTNPTNPIRAVVIEWNDDSSPVQTSRLVLQRVYIADRAALQLQRGAALAFGVTMHCLDDSGTFGYLLTNDTVIATNS